MFNAQMFLSNEVLKYLGMATLAGRELHLGVNPSVADLYQEACSHLPFHVSPLKI